MKPSKETIIRTVVLALSIVNRILVSTGHSVLPFDNDEVAQLVSDIIVLAAAGWAWWKNNSFTKHAIEADNVLAELKERDNDEDCN